MELGLNEFKYNVVLRNVVNLTFTNESLKRIKRRKLERARMASDVLSRYSTLSPHSSGNGTWAESSSVEKGI